MLEYWLTSHIQQNHSPMSTLAQQACSHSHLATLQKTGGRHGHTTTTSTGSAGMFWVLGYAHNLQQAPMLYNCTSTSTPRQTALTSAAPSLPPV
jgi:hypothetical protein